MMHFCPRSIFESLSSAGSWVYCKKHVLRCVVKKIRQPVKAGQRPISWSRPSSSDLIGRDKVFLVNQWEKTFIFSTAAPIRCESRKQRVDGCIYFVHARGGFFDELCCYQRLESRFLVRSHCLRRASSIACSLPSFHSRCPSNEQAASSFTSFQKTRLGSIWQSSDEAWISISRHKLTRKKSSRLIIY